VKAFVGSNPTPRTLQQTLPTFCTSFALPVNLVVFSLRDVFESSFYELFILFEVVGDFNSVFIIAKVDKLRVDECIVDISMTKQLHDMWNVFGFRIFYDILYF
jgi:hypothetical protein